MKKFYKLGVSLCGAISIATPIITVISCAAEDKLPHFDIEKTVTKIMMQDLSKIDAIAPYSNFSLQAEAKKIGGDVIWRGSLQQESIAQGINLLYQLAEKLGFNLTEQLKSINVKLITDEIANKTDAEALAELNIVSNTDESETAIHLKNIKLNPISATDEMRKFTFKMSPGNQTIDGDSDFKQMNLESPELAKYGMYTDDEFQNDPTKTPYAVDGLRGRYLINTWISGKDINVIFGAKEGSVVRKIVSPNASQDYPSIKDESDFAENYAPFASGLIQKFIGSLGDSIDLAPMFVGSPLGSVISYLLNEFATKTIDLAGVTTKTIDFTNDATKSKFAHAISEVNKTGNINWLAIKAFYLGFDKSLTENGYENWTVRDKDWVVGEDFSGVKQFKNFVDLINISRWQHSATNTIFNPRLSVEDNIKLNERFRPFN